MAGSRALVVSVLAHGAALGALASWGHGDPHESSPRATEAPLVIEVVAPAASAPTTPIEVAFLDDPRPTRSVATSEVAAPRAPKDTNKIDGVPRKPSDPSATPSPGTGAIASRAASESSTPREPTSEPGEPTSGPGEPNGAPPGGSALGPLAMRGRRHDLALSAEAAARSLGPDRPLEPGVKPTGRIAPAGREGRIDDAVAKFRVHGDGTVSITDKRDFTLEWRVPLPTPSRILEGAKAIGDDLAAWREDPYRDTRAGSWQDLPRHLQATPGGCMKFGDEMCDAVEQDTGTRRTPTVQRSLSGDGVIIPILSGKADITSYLHRKFIGDPFASRKLKLLDDTRAERVESGRVYRAKQLAGSAEIMANNLAALWAATADPAERREALFELWDECSEGEGEPGAAGDRARAMVIGWIGAHLPRGGSEAYGEAEIARLDAKRASRQHFAPYLATP